MIYLTSQNNLKFNFCNKDFLSFRVALEHFDVFTVFTKIAKARPRFDDRPEYTFVQINSSSACPN